MITKNNIPAVIAAAEQAKPKALLSAALIVSGTAKTLTPVDTGRLRASIVHGLYGSDDAWVGTNVEYGGYVEYGTYKMAKQPYLRPAVDTNRAAIQQVISDIIGAAIKGAAK